MLAAELARLDVPAEDEHYLDNSGPLRFAAETGEEPSPLAAAGGRKVAVGIAGLLAVALVGLLIGISALGGDDDPQPNPVAAPTSSAPAGDATPAAATARQADRSSDVRIIDPDSKNRSEVDDAEKVIDGDEDKGWETETYRTGPTSAT